MYLRSSQMFVAHSAQAVRTRPRSLIWLFHHSDRLASTTASSRHSGYETTFTRPPSAYGWRYHLDNTIQFILWASFGSAAIHLLNIKQKYSDKERRLSTKIAVLKDVIKRIQEGEDVDIARELGTGRTEDEREWQEVMDSFREDAGLDITKSLIYDPVETSQLKSLAEDDIHSGSSTLPYDATTVKATGNSSGWFWRS